MLTAADGDVELEPVAEGFVQAGRAEVCGELAAGLAPLMAQLQHASLVLPAADIAWASRGLLLAVLRGLVDENRRGNQRFREVAATTRLLADGPPAGHA